MKFILGLLADIKMYFLCVFRDLHTYRKNAACEECTAEHGPVDPKYGDCPDCGRKAVHTISICCKKQMWIHLV